MVDFKVNQETNDVDFSALQLVTDGDAFGQRLRLALQTRQGEFYRDNRKGLDFDLVYDKRTTDDERLREIRRVILEDRETQEVLSLTIAEKNTSERVLKVDGRILSTENNIVNLNGVSI